MTARDVIEYTLGHDACEQLRRAARVHGAGAAELAAINRLDAFTARAVDVQRLEPLAKLAGLPWRELFAGTLELASLSSDESGSVVADMAKKKNEPAAQPEPRPVGRPARAGEAADNRPSVRATDAEIEAWRAAAERAELSLSDWMREACNRAAKR